MDNVNRHFTEDLRTFVVILLTTIMVVLLTKAASVYTVAVLFCYHGCHVY